MISYMTILIVEDDSDIRALMSFHLKGQGYSIEEAKDGEEAVEKLSQSPFDLVILDLMLPKIQGLEVLSYIRTECPERNTPVIVASALTGENDIITALESGADDYITKPFSPKELVLRVEALFRRTDGQGSESSARSYSLGESTMVIDEDEHKLTIDGEIITLTAAEWRIVAFLASNSPNLISRAQILEECFDYSFESYERVVDTHIKNIRAKLKKEGWIETVRGYGYRFAGKKI